MCLNGSENMFEKCEQYDSMNTFIYFDFLNHFNSFYNQLQLLKLLL